MLDSPVGDPPTRALGYLKLNSQLWGPGPRGHPSGRCAAGPAWRWVGQGGSDAGPGWSPPSPGSMRGGRRSPDGETTAYFY